MNPLASASNQLDDILRRVAIKLQLTQAQRQKAEETYREVSEWLSKDSSVLAKANPDIYPQGSLRTGTTVRPLKRYEFDLDLVCQLEIDYNRIGPVELMDVVEKRILDHPVFAKLMMRRKPRCIRLQFAKSYHLDIVPACPHGYSNNGNIVIPDRKLEKWLTSNPKGYAHWFEERAAQYFTVVEARQIEPLPAEEDGRTKPALKYVVQLLKRHRDIFFANESTKLTPKSIVVSTLAGQVYDGSPSIVEALIFVVEQIEHLAADSGRLVVLNPAERSEDLSESWAYETDAYESFKTWIHSVRLDLAALSSARGIQDVGSKLQVMFGENPVKTAIYEHQLDTIDKSRNSRTLRVGGPYAPLIIGGSAGRSVPKNTNFGS